jgi:hypothetical protein
LQWMGGLGMAGGCRCRGSDRLVVGGAVDVVGYGEGVVVLKGG